MSKQKPKKPISFRIRPELYQKFRSYCSDNGLNQTEVFETWIELLNTDRDSIKEPVSLISLAQRLEALEAEISQPASRSTPRPVQPTAKPKQTAKPVDQPQTASPDAEYYSSREAGNVMGYSENTDVSTKLKRKGLTPVKFGGQAHYWDKQQVHALAKERGINVNDI